MVMSTARKRSTICTLVPTVVTNHVGKRQILVSLGSTTLGAHGWHPVLLEAETVALLTVGAHGRHPVLLEAETVALLTVQVDSLQQFPSISLIIFFKSTYIALQLQQSIMNGD